MDVPLGAPVEEIVVVAQGGIESYGFHALEMAAVGMQPHQEGAVPKEPAAFLVEYRDGVADV